MYRRHVGDLAKEADLSRLLCKASAPLGSPNAQVKRAFAAMALWASKTDHQRAESAGFSHGATGDPHIPRSDSARRAACPVMTSKHCASRGERCRKLESAGGRARVMPCSRGVLRSLSSRDQLRRSRGQAAASRRRFGSALARFKWPSAPAPFVGGGVATLVPGIRGARFLAQTAWFDFLRHSPTALLLLRSNCALRAADAGSSGIEVLGGLSSRRWGHEVTTMGRA